MAKKSQSLAVDNLATETPKKERITNLNVKDTVSVSFRTERILKRRATEVFEDMGLSMSAAINMFLAQSVKEQGLPFQPAARRKKNHTTHEKTKDVDDLDNAEYILEELWNEL